jgi:hypothetical protein
MAGGGMTGTGPQTALIAGDSEDDWPADNSSGFLRAAQDQDKARSHARTRRSWVPRRFRREAPAPVSRLLAAKSGEELAELVRAASDVVHGDVGPGAFTQAIDRYQPAPLTAEAFTRPGAPESREDEAASRIIAERSGLARMYAPPAISAIPWEMWDTAANREAMQPVYVPDLSADLAENPGFREAVHGHFIRLEHVQGGRPADGETWQQEYARIYQERFTGALADIARQAASAPVPDFEIERQWAAVSSQAATEAGLKEYDARHPVPEVLAPESGEGVAA